MQQIQAWFGDSQSAILALVVVSLVCRFIGKIIPDNATGFKGFVRDCAKLLGLYVSNRIEPGLSVGDVAKEVQNNDTVTVAETARRVALSAQPAVKRGPGGKFLKPDPTQSGFVHVGLLIFLALGAALLTACTPQQIRIIADVTNKVCTSVPVAQAALDAAAESKDKDRAQKLLTFLSATCPSILAKLDSTKAVDAGVVPVDTN